MKLLVEGEVEGEGQGLPDAKVSSDGTEPARPCTLAEQIPAGPIGLDSFSTCPAWMGKVPGRG